MAKKKTDMQIAMDKVLKFLALEGRNLTPSEVIDKRTALVNRYGKKILTEPENSDILSLEEKCAKKMYVIMSKELYKAAPATKTPDKILEFMEKKGIQDDFDWWKYLLTNGFKVIIGILVILALLKFILS